MRCQSEPVELAYFTMIDASTWAQRDKNVFNVLFLSIKMIIC